MDERRFDEVTREIGATRRGALGLFAGGLGLLVAVVPDWADAKKRKRKKKKKAKARCTPDGDYCPPSESECCGQQCCLGYLEPLGGQRYCAPPSVVCCPVEVGAGACPNEFPICCPTAIGCAKTFEECNVDALHGSAGRAARITLRG